MKFSIITVCLNSNDYIEQTIKSVLAQDYSDFEYVLIDGGSTDGTLDIIRRFCEDDKRVRYLSEADRGIADAMNKGVSVARGDIVAHLNSDDYYHDHNVLTRVADCFRSTQTTEWLAGGFNLVSESGEFIREIRPRRYSFRRLLRGNIILHPATFIRRERLLAVGGFDINLQYCMDYDLFLRLGQRSQPFVLNSQLTCFRIHSRSRSVAQSEKAYAEEYMVRMKYLKGLGRSTWFYTLDYQLKRHLNKFFYRRLLSEK